LSADAGSPPQPLRAKAAMAQRIIDLRIILRKKFVY